MSWTARLVLAAALAGVSAVQPIPAPAQREPSSIVIVTGQQATVPVPTLMEGPLNTTANTEIADHLFLRLAGVGPGMVTAGDRGFEPRLARSWSRRDSLTLVFELDPRARWHDGAPVTARDVTFTYGRARDSTIAPRLADVTHRIASVEAEGDHRVVFRFKDVYAEQFYDATFHVAILRASNTPFYAQFRDVVGTALRTSIRFTNRIKGRTASVADHAAVRDAIAAHDPDAARSAMRHLIGDVLMLIDDAEK